MNSLMLNSGVVLVDRYVVEQYLASGGMQEVYICHDLALDRRVVVKTPKGGIKDRRFRRGAEMGARISHHNVASTFDYFEDDKLTFMVEEFVEGKDLGKRLNLEFLCLDPALAAYVIHNITRALYQAHKVGICHRDLKPSNVMTSDDPGMRSIKLTDFGIAKMAESEIAEEMEKFEQDESTLTASNTLLGAVPYMAPECWSNWREAGQPMDIWALGCIAYQLLAGTPPFGTGRPAIANVIRVEQLGKVDLSPPKWFGNNKSTQALEKDLWNMILACIQPNPTVRPDAAALLTICGTWCYAVGDRRRGVINNFGVPYYNGGVSSSGYVIDLMSQESLFFHVSEYFGGKKPQAGQNVIFSPFPGSPRRRASPVLLTK